MDNKIKNKVKASVFTLASESGFTLIELIVVMAVLGTILFITLPKFGKLTLNSYTDNSYNNYNDETINDLNLLISTIKELKKKSVYNGIDYILNLDIEHSLMWITSIISESDFDSNNKNQNEYSNNIDKNLDLKINKNKLKKDNLKDKDGKMSIPDSFYITDVESYGAGSRKIEDKYAIKFSSRGYCTMSLIHIKERGTSRYFTIIIEPFTLDIKIRKKYISFEQCS